MTRHEANELFSTITDQSELIPEYYQIGNGEWVLQVHQTFIWNRDDWNAIKYERFASNLYKPRSVKREALRGERLLAQMDRR